MDIKLFSQEQLCSAEPILSEQLHIWIMPNSGGHAILHQLLGFYLGCSPDDLLLKKEMCIRDSIYPDKKIALFSMDNIITKLPQTEFKSEIMGDEYAQL